MFKTKLRSSASLLIALALVSGNQVFAQSHNWNTQARQQAENSNSRALSILTKGETVKGYVDQAIAALLRATSADPTDPVPFATLGLALDLKQRYSEALDALNKSYQLEPKSKETMLSIAITHYLGRTYAKSESVLNTLLKQFPTQCDAHIDLGFTYIRLGDFDKARRNFKQAISCNPNCQPAYQGEALCDYLEGNLEDAFAEVQHAETLRPYLPATLLLAEIAAIRGDETAMNSALKRVAKVKQPLEQRPMTMIGFSPQHDFHWDPFILDDFDTDDFIKARALDLPRQDSKRASLAGSGKISKALTHVEAALSSAPPNDFYLLRQAGLINLAAGNYGDAVKIFNDVTQACPNSHIDFLYLGRALWLAGNKADAAKCIKVYAEHFPSQQLAGVFTSIKNNAPAAPEAPPTQPSQPTQQPAVDTGF
ncbi:MAG TPA: tetratricopeptide repeat protein [Drouetiella sp.]